MKYIATALTALVLSVPAQAAVHIYEFTASVMSLTELHRYEFLPSTGGIKEGSVISVGDRIVGRFSYDSSAVATSDTSWMQTPDLIAYHYATPASQTNFFSFSILPSGQTVSSSDIPGSFRRMGLSDGTAGVANREDSLSIYGGADFDPSFSLNFRDLTGTMASNGKLPEQLSLSNVNYAFLDQSYFRADGTRISLFGKIDSLTNTSVTAVPEPGTWAMLLAGLSILGFSARRKRS